MAFLTRRALLKTSVPALGAGVALLRGAPGSVAADGTAHAASGHAGAMAHPGGHAAFRGGVADAAFNGFDPHTVLRDFDSGTASRTADGRVLREWELVATAREIELAPGVRFQAWAYNGRVPGPTLRAHEGDRLRITLVNASAHPHTIHFHGIHPSTMDGVPGIGAGQIGPGQRTVYEFDAQPSGVHLYHCHTRPLAEHIAKGLFGAFIIDPPGGRADADELVMVMNGWDTNFDRQNEIYAVNAIGFAYMDRPIQVTKGRLVRVYLVNVLEYDPINSFHIHGNLFNYYPTGTGTTPSEYTDTVMLCQGQRGILEWRFPSTGRFMFHAHQSEFTELGWQGFFEVCEQRGTGRLNCDISHAAGGH